MSKTAEMSIVLIAIVCHEANRAYCKTIGDDSQPAWADAPEWQRTSAIKGVEYHLSNPNAKPSQSHESWLEEKRANGWQYGPVKDAEKKLHPCFIPYDGLPEEQKAKDALFISVVHALAGPLGAPISIPPITLAGRCNELRAECKKIENECRSLKNSEAVTGPSCMRPMTSAELEQERLHPKPCANTPEMMANIMLAVRHLEDARMRLGKVIQYSGDGISIYDKA